MRKDIGNRKDLSLYVRVSVEGRNLPALINVLSNKGIDVYKVNKVAGCKTLLSVKYSDYQKFFAITRELCYTVKRIKEHGAIYPFLLIKRNIGFFIGILIFCISAYISNDYIFKIAFTGTGAIYEKEIVSELNGLGVSVYKKFSSFDLNEIADKVLSKNGNVNFLSLKKQGNTLIVNSEKRTVGERVFEKKEKLLSTACGIVENVVAYRGTPTVTEGTFVKEGDLLIDGYMAVKDQVVFTGVIGKVTVLCEDTFSYICEDGKDTEVLLLAKESLNRETAFENVIKTQTDGGYLYTVTLKYRVQISVL